MKKYVKFISIGLILSNMIILNVNASSGKLRSSSITSCNGVTYGQHSSDNHWHIAKKTENGYYPEGDAIYSNPCMDSNEYIEEETKETTTNQITSNETTTKTIKGCTDTSAINYNQNAKENDNSCQYKKEIVEIVTIPYETIIESENKEGKEVIINDGKNGFKEVTYQKILDSSDNEISSEITNEKIIEEPINKIIKYEITNEETNTKGNNIFPIFVFILLVLCLINYLHIKKEKNVFSILGNIKKVKKSLRILLYILYYLYIIPVIIDFISILIYLLKVRKNIKTS